MVLLSLSLTVLGLQRVESGPAYTGCWGSNSSLHACPAHAPTHWAIIPTPSRSAEDIIARLGECFVSVAK